MRVSAFMDFTKVQQDVIKSTLAGDKNKYRYGTVTIDGNERIALIINGTAAVFIPKLFYLLDNEAVFRDQQPVQSIDSMIKSEADATPLKVTSELVMRPEYKKPLQVFKREDEKIYVDTRLLDVFKTAVYINYSGTGKKTPVYVYAGKDLIGLVLPVNIKEDE